MVYIIGNKLKIEWHSVCKACSSILFKVEAGGLDKISVGEISRWDGLFIVRNLTSSHLFHLVTWKFSTLIFSAAFFLVSFIYIFQFQKTVVGDLALTRQWPASSLVSGSLTEVTFYPDSAACRAVVGLILHVI